MDQLTSDPALDALTGVLNGALADQMDGNRHAARRAAAVVEAIRFARSHSYIYSDLPGDDGEDAAEAAVLLELSLRLHLSENQLRTMASTAGSAAARLPYLWRRANEGFAAFPLVEATTAAIIRLLPPVGADEATREAAEAAIGLVDDATGDWVVSLTPAAFRRRLRILIDRLDPRDPTTRHADALAERRVIFDDPDEVGMGWMHVYAPAIELLAAKRRLTSTAKHTQKCERGGRTRDQIRADLATAWLRGQGTTTAVKTKVFVTVPVGVLAGVTADSHGRCTLCGGTGYPESAKIVGGPDIDPLTAKQLFLDTPAFHRVITDPVRGVVVDLDRRRYTPTQAQRDWLTLQHGTCARDGCTRLAQDSDIDHRHEWAKGGRTNLKDLRPLCPPDHTRRHSTRLKYRSRPNGTVQVQSPTGYTSDEPPPF